MLPHIQFAACCTSWTNEVVIGILKKLPNVRVLDSSHRVDDIFEQTKVLLVPSVWPEAFGLVATEACARGIPCVSSKHGGLVEANVLATVDGCDAFGIDTPIFHDHDAVRMRHGTSMEEMEEGGGGRARGVGTNGGIGGGARWGTPSPEAAKADRVPDRHGERGGGDAVRGGDREADERRFVLRAREQQGERGGGGLYQGAPR